jgi:SAM-dependent methyltransferase
MQHSFADPVAAYDAVAPGYEALARRRQAYLTAIERLVIGCVPAGSRTYLDAGAGTGERSLRIARAAGLRSVVLLEPSSAMLGHRPQGCAVWPLRAEQLGTADGQFDVITCLWNVLGHVFPRAARVEVLRQFARLSAPRGAVFVDVNHRYNVRHYGLLPTALRALKDRIRPNESNGDVVAAWRFAGVRYRTKGHVFTEREVRELAAEAGLEVVRRWAVDYRTGEVRRSAFEGHLLFLLHRFVTSQVVKS